jgi:hypothetical protein
LRKRITVVESHLKKPYVDFLPVPSTQSEIKKTMSLDQVTLDFKDIMRAANKSIKIPEVDILKLQVRK